MSTNCIQCIVKPRTGPDLLCDDCRSPITERIRPPEPDPPKKQPSIIQRREHDPLTEKRITMALKEYRRELNRYGNKGASIFYGTPRFSKSRRYKQTMGIFANIIAHLDEQRFIHQSEIPWEVLTRDWVKSIFTYYQRKFNRSPIPPQLSPTNKVIQIFDIYVEKYDQRYGDVPYWQQKPLGHAWKTDQDKRLRKQRRMEVTILGQISSEWTKDKVLADIRSRFGNQIKSIDDYIEHGGKLTK